ncbi:two-component sensor histidine kinase [Flexivirga endophytica]|uniref:histidine kinase n=1 Tax=Flexivirga endophytica TaxID=1849103 RepID=A0A916TAM4_9MICO|nr:histidine kinase [Flexivirga endophytica]GGB36638.1 two-component sensor histidine kinase [Flexivirga endophytica]GHB44270.1 two-component sensor histidine kinase [Flexivirga endophytica]
MLKRLRRELESSDDDVLSGSWIDLFDERVQPLLAALFVTLSFLTLRPIGGHTVLTYALVALCGALAFVRLLPDRLLSLWPRFAVSVAFGVTAGMAFGASGWCVSLAFVACSHFGARWPTRVAVCLTVMTVVTAMICNPAAGSDAWEWYVVMLVGLTVLPGLASQSRKRTLRLSARLVEQTMLTAESDARASALAERTRIARDIHDVLAHSLSGVSLQLDLADAQLEAGCADDGRATVQTARGLVVDGLDEARRAVRALREGTIDLRSTLDRMVQPGEEFDFSDAVGDVDSRIGQEMVRIVQEALTNARRHAHGAKVRVTVGRVGDELTAEVVNGRGEEIAAGAGSGLGLVGIRERVDLLGGSCSIGPVGEGSYAGGWQVAVRLPMQNNNDRGASVR